MDKYEHTIKTWDMLAQKYQDGFMNLTLYDESYDTFCESLQIKNASILEIGCGPGNITKYLFNKRPDYKIHATDAAPSMIALAQKNNPTATFEVMDCRDISKIKRKFDAIVCGFCLPYIANNDCVKLIKDSATLLNIEGIIYLSTIEGNYENSKTETSSDGKHSMFVYYYSEAFIKKVLAEQLFKIIKIIRIPYVKGDGTNSIHLIFIAKKM